MYSLYNNAIKQLAIYKFQTRDNGHYFFSKDKTRAIRLVQYKDYALAFGISIGDDGSEVVAAKPTSIKKMVEFLEGKSTPKTKTKCDTVIVTARVDRKAHAKLKRSNVNVSSIIQDAILMAADKVEK